MTMEEEPKLIEGSQAIKSKAKAYEEERPDIVKMRVETMYKLVEDCDVTIGGKVSHKKLLYLRHEYAAHFDDKSMKRCLQELDIREPKFVIKLLPSLGLHSLMRQVHCELKGTAEGEFEDPVYSPSDFEAADDYLVREKVALFMKTCILPIATKTRALILVGGANDCCLSTALSDVAFAEQERLGKNCPFTVLATVDVSEIYYAAERHREAKETTIAGQVLGASDIWKRRYSSVKALADAHMKKPLQRCDLTPIASRYIVFEGFNPELQEFSSSSRLSFEGTLLQVLTRDLPIVAIQCCNIDMNLPYLCGLAARNVPTILLDTNERSIAMNQVPSKGPSTITAQKLNAFPFISEETLKRIEIDDKGMITLEGRKVILQMAQTMIEEKWSQHIAYGYTDSYDSSVFSLLLSALQLGSEQIKFVAGKNMDISLYEEIQEAQAALQNNTYLNNTTSNKIPLELATIATTFVLQTVVSLDILARMSRVVKWLIENYGPEGVRIVEDEKKKLLSKKLLEAAVNHYVSLSAEFETVILNDGKYIETKYSPGNIASVLELFTNPQFFAGSIHEIKAIEGKITAISRIDRLPESNSLEALTTLQFAWDDIDKYHAIATYYKHLTKASYIVILGLGICVTILSILDGEGYDVRAAIIILGFVTTAVVGFVTFMNPAVRWQQLRVAALTLEGQVYMFRSRVGSYRLKNDGRDDLVDRSFYDNICDIQREVLEGADMQNTVFYSWKRDRFNGHQQHPSKKDKLEAAKKNVKPSGKHPTLKSKNKNEGAAIFGSAASSDGNSLVEEKDVEEGIVDSNKESNDEILRKKLKQLRKSKLNNALQSSWKPVHVARSLIERYPLSPTLHDKKSMEKEDMQAYQEELRNALNDALLDKNNEFRPELKDALDDKFDIVKKEINPGHDVYLILKKVEKVFDDEEKLVDAISDRYAITKSNKFKLKHTTFKSKGNTDTTESKEDLSVENEMLQRTRQEEITELSTGNLNLYHLLVNDDSADVFHPKAAIPFDAVVTCLRPSLCSEIDTVDNHYEVLTPDMYLTTRLEKKIEFYKKRIPKYYTIRMISQGIQIFGSIAVSALAIWARMEWTAAVTISVAAVIAYVEFHGTEGKIKRYSTTVHGLEGLIDWWKALPQIDRSSTENIDRLILTAETILNRDHMSWKATSQAVKLLQSATSSNSNSASDSSSASNPNANPATKDEPESEPELKLSADDDNDEVKKFSTGKMADANAETNPPPSDDVSPVTSTSTSSDVKPITTDTRLSAKEQEVNPTDSIDNGDKATENFVDNSDIYADRSVIESAGTNPIRSSISPYGTDADVPPAAAAVETEEQDINDNQNSIIHED